MPHVAAGDGVGPLDAAQNSVAELLGFWNQVRALPVVRTEVADPVLAQDLLTEAVLPRVALGSRLGAVPTVALVVVLVLALEPGEGVGRSPQPKDWLAALQVVVDVPHLLVGEVLEAQEDNHQIRVL